MKKFLLVATAAAAMIVVALPSASVASSTKYGGGTKVYCPPGTTNPKYCERKPPPRCPPGVRNRRYCERHHPAPPPCPTSSTYLQSTADAAATAALDAAEGFTDRSGSIGFSFLPTACGSFSFTLQFAVPGRWHHTRWLDVAAASNTTTAGTTDSISAWLSFAARSILARDAAHHIPLTVSVIAVESADGTSETSQLFDTFNVGHHYYHRYHI